MKTRDTLKQHRKKLHNLLTPVPKNALVEEPVSRGTTPGVGSDQGTTGTGSLVEEQRIGMSSQVINSMGTVEHRIITNIGSVGVGVLPKL